MSGNWPQKYLVLYALVLQLEIMSPKSIMLCVTGLLLCDIPLYEFTTMYLPIHMLVDIWVISSLGVGIKLL